MLPENCFSGLLQEFLLISWVRTLALVVSVEEPEGAGIKAATIHFFTGTGIR